MTEYTRPLDFVFGTETGQRIELTYEASSQKTNQTITGSLVDGHLSEMSSVQTDDDGPAYVVWNGSGINGRETGDVVKETDDSRRKVGTFVYAKVIE